MSYLRSLGQYPGDSGFEVPELFAQRGDLPEEMIELRETGFGLLSAVKHAATVEGYEVAYGDMPKQLGSDIPEWKLA
jgi:hypothetical protein